MLTCRIPTELDELLSARAAELEITKAELVRGILAAGLGDDAQLSALREAHYRLQPALRSAFAKISKLAQRELPAFLQESLEALEDAAE